jgi:hypothetical protein
MLLLNLHSAVSNNPGLNLHRIASHPLSRYEEGPSRNEDGKRRTEQETSSLSVSELLSTTISAIRAIALHNLAHPPSTQATMS